MLIHWHVPVEVLRPVVGAPRPLRIVHETVPVGSRYHQRGGTGHRQGSRHWLFKFSLAGQGEVATAAGSWPVPAGSGMVVRPADTELVYRLVPGAQADWSFIYMAFDGPDDLLAALTRDGPVIRLGHDHPLILRLLAIGERVKGTWIIDAAAAHALVADLITALLAVRAGPEPHAVITRLGALCQEHLPQAVSVGAAAAHCGITREHLNRLVQKELGLTAQAWLQRRQLEYGRTMLDDASQTIGAVASALGYATSSHFARAFRRCFGISPSAYRRGTPV